ncbi:MAG: hypothetical protein JNK05_22180 [Myxococcales bacterium]|nr:hypothetical protein [Myxococcales bacterium]
MILCATSCAHEINAGSFVDARPAAPLSVPPNADELAAARRIDASHATDLGFYAWPSLCIAPWLALLGLALWHRSRARRAFDAVVRRGPVVPGRRELEGTVEPIDEPVPITVELSKDRRTVIRASTSPFFLRLSTGERVRVDRAEPIELRAPETAFDPDLTHVLLDVASGDRVAVDGVVTNEAHRPDAGPYRDGTNSEIRASSEGVLIVARGGSTPVHNSRARTARNGMALALVGLVSSAVIAPYEALSLRATGVSQWGAIIGHRSTRTDYAATRSTSSPTSSTITEYAVRVRVGDRVFDDDVPVEVYECAREGRCTRVPVVLSTFGPRRSRVGTRPFFDDEIGFASVAFFVLAALIYASHHRERPWFTARIDPPE